MVWPLASTGATATGAWSRLVVEARVIELGAERVESVSRSGANMAGTLFSGCLMLPIRLVGLVLGLFLTPFRGLVAPSVMRGRGSEAPDRVTVPVTPFVVQRPDGTVYDCLIRGELRGGFVRLGEDVRLTGVLDRARVLRVERVESLRTGAVTKGWVDPKARSAPAAAVLGVFFAVLIVYLVLKLLRVI